MTDISSWLGRQQEIDDVITPSSVKRFYAALNLQALEVDLQNNVAPLGYHWCLCLPDTPLDQLAEDGHPKKGGFLPPVPFPRRMWASAKTEFIADLPIGSNVKRISEIVSIDEKVGKSGSLVFVEVAHQTMLNGLCAIKEQQTIVYREASQTPMPLPNSDGGRPKGWQIVEELLPTTPMLFRYSSLTFNSHRIHYDLNYAREQEMYPELLVHGPLQATLALQLAARRAKVKTFSFRGVAPAFCHQPLFLVANFDGNVGELATIGADGQERLLAKAGF